MTDGFYQDFTPLRTDYSDVNKLKAELAQLADENRRLKVTLMEIEALKITSPNRFSERIQLEETITLMKYKARKALQTPLTPGLGAAMLRVVEAAKAHVNAEDDQLYGKDGIIPTAIKLIHAVNALNEMEAKRE